MPLLWFLNKSEQADQYCEGAGRYAKNRRHSRAGGSEIFALKKSSRSLQSLAFSAFSDLAHRIF
tara:strand:- start:175 stop:366 length:192 start_codon:yes stop_codon:yes gene_type:complete